MQMLVDMKLNSQFVRKKEETHFNHTHQRNSTQTAFLKACAFQLKGCVIKWHFNVWNILKILMPHRRILCCHGKQLPSKHTQDSHNDAALKGGFSVKAQETFDLHYIILSSKLCRAVSFCQMDPCSTKKV